MTLNNFIFSNALKFSFARHLAFWTVFSLHFVIQNLMIGGPGEASTSRTFPESFGHFLYFLPTYLLSTYLVIEVLLPKFLYPRRWAGFIFSFLLLFSISFVSIYYSGVLYIHHSMKQAFSQVTFHANKYHAVVDGLFLPFMLWGIAAGIKFAKKWLLQQRENEKLAKQKLATELQLLKTSIHPRFLFHSLHTVQRHINNSSELSPALILQLSDLLSYILYEKDEYWVTLEKELEIIRHYIHLEEKGFEEPLLFKTELPEKNGDKFIVPFLLLSLVEGSFEYFFETQQQAPLLTLIIRINENTLHLQLLISRPAGNLTDTGFLEEKLHPFKKQLQNHYEGLHQLQVIVEGETISINLKLPLYSGDLINSKKYSIIHEVPEPV